MPKLQISLPDGSQLDHELTDEIVTIGRTSDNTIEVNDPSVSSHHAQIEPAGDDYILKDLGSTNGTRLNDKAAGEGQEFKLDAGDRIRFGKVEAVFDPENAAEEQALPETKDRKAKVAKSSVKPSNFQNASPFQKTQKKADPGAIIAYVLAGIALVAVLGVLVSVLKMQAPV